MGKRRAPETGEMTAPGPVHLPTEPIERAGQGSVDTDQPDGDHSPTENEMPPALAAEEPPARSGGKRPEPVLDAARLAGAISAGILAIGGLLKLVGIVVPADYDLQPLADQAAAACLAIAGAWTVVGPWITARIKARDRVTPLADPRDAYGRRLTPEEP